MKNPLCVAYELPELKDSLYKLFCKHFGFTPVDYADYIEHGWFRIRLVGNWMIIECLTVNVVRQLLEFNDVAYDFVAAWEDYLMSQVDNMYDES
jgi:hypothetical protein